MELWKSKSSINVRKNFFFRPWFNWFFFLSAPVAFRRVALETPEWTSRDSNHHRQSVSAGKTNAIPTEPSGRLVLGLIGQGRNPVSSGFTALSQKVAPHESLEHIQKGSKRVRPRKITLARFLPPVSSSFTALSQKVTPHESLEHIQKGFKIVRPRKITLARFLPPDWEG